MVLPNNFLTDANVNKSNLTQHKMIDRRNLQNRTNKNSGISTDKLI